MNDLNRNDAPPLSPELPPEEVERMSADETADYLTNRSLASLNRYKGRPDLLLQENPHRDFRRFENKAPAA